MLPGKTRKKRKGEEVLSKIRPKKYIMLRKRLAHLLFGPFWRPIGNTHAYVSWPTRSVTKYGLFYLPELDSSQRLSKQHNPHCAHDIICKF